MVKPFVNSAISSVIFAGLFTSVSQAADKEAVQYAPPTSAVQSPTPQPPTPESSIQPQTPPTPSALKYDKNGMPLLAVEFMTDHYDIPASFRSQVDVFGKYLQDHPGTTAKITGHTDNSGHAPANGDLAQKRADAIASYIEKHFNISSNRLKAQGYGEVQDKINNSTADSKQADRRAFGEIIAAK